MRRLVGVLLLSALSGCGSSALEAPDGPPDGGGAPDAGAVPDAGGASDTDPVGAPTDAFIGTWRYVSGTENVQCPTINVNSVSQLAGQTEVFSQGVQATIVNSNPGDVCIFSFDIEGNIATARRGQTCMTNIATDQGNIPTTLSLVSAVFSVNGTTARYSRATNFTLNVNAQSIPCAATSSGDLLRISP